MNMIRLVESFNLFLAVLFTVAYFYQLVYLVMGLVKRRRWKQAEAAQYHRYAAVISARNEAGGDWRTDSQSEAAELSRPSAGHIRGFVRGVNIW